MCIAVARPLAHPLNLTMELLMQDEHLVGEARERRKQRMDARERVVDTLSALLFLAAAVAIARPTGCWSGASSSAMPS
jgi:hypothetical protein